MKNTIFAFIKELDRHGVLLQANGEEVNVALTEENRQFIFEAIEQGTYIVPFNKANQEIVMDLSSLHYPEMGSPALKDADYVSASN
ncbi:hypothetical protein [Metasolibacillus sp.]|uniref:hypothetical protein n=1 Tax=Metasolibacillus sp. TaxID=2703680 RepID=UPI0025FDAFF3|nr:hypothetical protein [Metasolibacillus sp.]MCT6922828.1 hypothetical protein [Metasolibacillus sp.]MCT6938833.1 hypothetical protein [Metasolibacillus sp.]